MKRVGLAFVSIFSAAAFILVAGWTAAPLAYVLLAIGLPSSLRPSC